MLHFLNILKQQKQILEKESNKLNKICPICKRPLTIGVENRVEELSERPQGFRPKNAVPYKKYIPLSDIISIIINKGVATKSTWSVYNKIIPKLGSEYDVLRNISKEELEKHLDKKIVDAIIKNREQKIKVKPGYDGVYGVPILEENQIIEQEKAQPLKNQQKGLNEYF